MVKETSRTKTMPGRCPVHGEVQAAKNVPNVAFPFIVYLVRMVGNAFQPYRCPQCSEKVTKTAS